MKNIVLIGMRGSGKTSVSRLLAKKLKLKHLGIDMLIVKEAHMPIREIVAKLGWNQFRVWENSVLLSLKNINNTVIDTGGGIITNIDNIQRLKELGMVIWLKTGIEKLNARIKNDKERPLLTGAKTMLEDIRLIAIERENLYKKTADIIVETDNKTVDKVCEEIIVGL